MLALLERPAEAAEVTARQWWSLVADVVDLEPVAPINPADYPVRASRRFQYPVTWNIHPEV